MIINLPSHSDFEKLGHDCLIQAFDIIFDTDRHVYEQYDIPPLREEIWAYSQGKLNTAVVLIHQAIEAFMKASICLTSPLLLLEGKRTDWPVMSKQRDKEFNDFYTTPSEALIYTYAAALPAKIDVALVEHIDKIRKLRNQIVHGIPKTKLTPKSLIENLLNTYIFFASKNTWWEKQIEVHFRHPLAQYYNSQYEFAKFAERLDYVEGQIGRAKFAKHFSFNTKGRQYFCPVCKERYESEAGDIYNSRWAFLKPNGSISTQVHCLNCENVTEIVRQDCPYNDCKGTVLSAYERSKCCLSCGRTVEWPGGENKPPIATEEQTGWGSLVRMDD